MCLCLSVVRLNGYACANVISVKVIRMKKTVFEILLNLRAISPHRLRDAPIRLKFDRIFIHAIYHFDRSRSGVWDLGNCKFYILIYVKYVRDTYV